MTGSVGPRGEPPILGVAQTHRVSGQARSEEDARAHGCEDGQDGEAQTKTAQPTFVIQEHHARALHWDFRLEHDGVLVSWALPKGLPLDPKTNHLAVHTEDHPWTTGRSPATSLRESTALARSLSGTTEPTRPRSGATNEIMVVLHGKRAQGRYVLFPTGEKNWMIHRMDPAPADYEAMPDHLAPMLALAGELPTRDKEWAYEFKWDGVRAMVYVDGGRVRALTRNDKTLMTTFPELHDIGEFLGSRSAILDGEIVALDKDGRPSFAHARPPPAPDVKDSDRASGQVKSREFLRLRRAVPRGPLTPLGHLRRASSSPGVVETSRRDVRDSSVGDQRRRAPRCAHRERARTGGRRRQAPQPRTTSRAVRNGDWIKIKNFQTQEVVIGGWTEGQGERAGSLGALLLGVHDRRRASPTSAKWVPVSRRPRRKELLDSLLPLARKTTPFSERLSPAETALAHFVRPQLVGEVQFAEWTPDGHLRHPSWRGLRTDKNASEVVREP